LTEELVRQGHEVTLFASMTPYHLMTLDQVAGRATNSTSFTSTSITCTIP
jgi:hypothetical protein